MSTSKIEIKIGEFSFNGEGEADWLDSQLDKILDKAKELIKLAPVPHAIQNPAGNQLHSPAHFSQNNEFSGKTLVTFLKEKNATNSQVEKFLATAAWLEAKGQKRLTTKEVSSALKQANQNRLGNASACLGKNVSKGFCEKDGNQFFVTQEGKDHLGLA